MIKELWRYKLIKMKSNNKIDKLSIGIDRTIDELGRIVIPKEMRDNLNLKKYDLVNIKLFNNYIQIEKSKSICNFCNNTDDLESYNNFSICKSCLNDIIEKFGK